LLPTSQSGLYTREQSPTQPRWVSVGNWFFTNLADALLLITGHALTELAIFKFRSVGRLSGHYPVFEFCRVGGDSFGTVDE
jgi:hypothetical protein